MPPASREVLNDRVAQRESQSATSGLSAGWGASLKGAHPDWACPLSSS